MEVTSESSTGYIEDPSGHSEDDHCLLFQFVVNSMITGTICLIGFIGNTASFMTLWQEKVCVTTFLLQGVVIADFAIIWMVFIGDCIPALSWIVGVLRDCDNICKYVNMVTNPLLFLAQICAIWLTLVALIHRYILMCKPSQVPLYCTLDAARKHVIIVIMTAMILTMPMTFDAGIHIAATSKNGTRWLQPLRENYWYQVIYKHGVTMFLVYVIPLLALVMFSIRLARMIRSIHRLHIRRTIAASYRTQHVDMTQLLLTLTITLVICYIPVIITRGFQWVHSDPVKKCGTLLYYLDSFNKIFLALNSSIKVMLLCMFVKDFRQKVGQNLSCNSCTKASKALPTEESSHSMYKCSDMSEMTLISNVDSRQ